MDAACPKLFEISTIHCGGPRYSHAGETDKVQRLLCRRKLQDLWCLETYTEDAAASVICWKCDVGPCIRVSTHSALPQH